MKFLGPYTRSDSLFAFNDELEIEEFVCESIESSRRGFDCESEISAGKAALRKIDDFKAKDSYEAERNRLRAEMKREPSIAALLHGTKKLNEHIAKPEPAKLAKDVANFFDGLNSPDPEQRERFRRVWEEQGLKDKSPAEMPALLALVERALGSKGRPKAVPPWRFEADHMEAMRERVQAGASIPEAARAVARDEGLARQDSRAKYLERLFRQKLALRGK